MSIAPPDKKLLRRLSEIKHVILILSGKGGVGKSTLTVQVALTLRNMFPTQNIGVLDTDLTGPSIPRMFGADKGEVIMCPKDENGDDGWAPVLIDGGKDSDGSLSCMSLAFLLESSSSSVVWRGPKKDAMVRQFLSEVRWGAERNGETGLDWLIIDTPPGTSDEHISLLESFRPILMPEYSLLNLPTLSAVLTTTPQQVSLLDVSKELTFIKRTGLPFLGLVENMAGYVCPHCDDVVAVFGKGGGEAFATNENIKFLGSVPIEQQLGALLEGSQTRNLPLSEQYQSTASSKIMAGIIESITQRISSGDVGNVLPPPE